MTDNSFARCAEPGCTESALSFASFCWHHEPHDTYPAKLRESLRNLPAGPVRLNLKKVETESLDFSHLDISHSSFSQSRLANCLFADTNLSGADLIGAKFRSCDFIGCDLRGANLARATLTHCSLSHSDLRQAWLTEAFFKETDFIGALLFEAVLWNADLDGAKQIKKKNFLQSSKSGRSHSHYRVSEKDALVAHESYRALKHYFYANGLYEDASWAGYRELTMERRHFLKKRDLRFFPSLMMDLLSGYTEKPNRVIMASLAIVLIFAGIFYLFNVPVPSSLASESRPTTFWESLYFSFITFTTVGYGDFTPRPVVWFRLLACIEAFSGPFMAGLYIFTLTRRYAAN